ncbi:pyroglutamylated RF-amide peptide receptor [Entelurus aequoreus]|uniref:pyroglutamylated RF-amide peptide receptor n=1 Tax=Entelurus aequoreus TaxID=161455 RepID=UPI002B1E578A|nr:pyroglutamylated RF-amide peptide receptor [Entelurus aequoreus]XP_061911472.1 pyroglutamylated RF-amide peptide receptor [Entelurus aequoreus]XP_061911473.1 pyroglutamylated RF-amide peptide receptor [Entelurus aequoreus]XP_061911474.1 pyroglutamylated RF-amide peptide receptor [Entelurus aequoreus]
MAADSSSGRITPEMLQETLQYYNLSRQDFISTYNIQPLVYVPELPRGAKTAFVLMYALIFLLALAGNSLVICVVLKKRAVHTNTDIFICSLAVSDLLITFFCVPFTLLQNISSEWFGGVLVCKTVPFVQTTAVVTGILTMTCIAIERYQGIVFPLRMRRQSTSKRAYKMLGLVWMASVVVGSPMLFVQQLKVKYDFVYDHHHVCCQEIWRSPTHRQAYTTFIMVALFLLPLAAMLFLYTRIAFELWIRKRVGDSSVLNTMNDRELVKISRKKKRAVKMMITIVLLFTVCWAPFHTVHMLFEYYNLENKFDDVTLNMIVAVVQAIGFFNSFNNPIVYAFMNENFQKSCVSTLSQCMRKHNRVVAATPPPPPPPPKAAVQFIRLQTREEFLESKEGAQQQQQARADKGQSSSSRGETTLPLVGEKISTIQTELAANSQET